MQPGKQNLPGEAVVVANAVARGGKAEQPVEQNCGPHVACRRLAPCLEGHHLAEGRQVAPQLFQRIHPVGHPLTDHEGIEGQLTPSMAAVVHEVPEGEGLLGERLIRQQQFGVGRQGQPEGDRGRTGHPSAAGRLPVAEDPAPAEANRLPGGDRLGEEHGGVGVVAGGEPGEFERHEGGIRIGRRLEGRDPVGPHRANHDRLDVAIGIAVLGVHRKHHEVLEPVVPVPLRMEGQQGIEEVGTAEAAAGPGFEVSHRGGEMVGLVGQVPGQGRDGLRDPRYELGCAVMVGRGDPAVGILERPDRRDGLGQQGPLGQGDDARWLGDRGFRLPADGRPGDQVQPQFAVVEVDDRVVADEVGVGGNDHPACPRPRCDEHGRRGGGRRGVGAGQHARAVGSRAGRQRACAIEAGFVHASEQVDDGAVAHRHRGVRLEDDPGGHIAKPMNRILHGRILDLDAEAGRDRGEGVAILRLFRLRQDHEAPARPDKRLDRGDLRGRVFRRPMPRGRLPVVARAMRQDEHVGPGEHVRTQRSALVHRHVEAGCLQRAGGLDEPAVGGVRRLHPRGHLRPRRPGLAVRLVEQHSGDDSHTKPARGGTARGNPS